MEFYGAAHYFFWEGIEAGLYGDSKNPYDYPQTEPAIQTKVSDECVESFVNGFLWGLVITEKEFENFFYVPEKKQPPKEKKVVSKEDEPNKKLPMVIDERVTWN